MDSQAWMKQTEMTDCVACGVMAVQVVLYWALGTVSLSTNGAQFSPEVADPRTGDMLGQEWRPKTIVESNQL